MAMPRRYRRAALICLVALTAAAGVGAAYLRVNADLLASLPAESAELKLFQEVGKKFGVLNSVLIGVSSDKLFTADGLNALRRISRTAGHLPGVRDVQSITEIPDVQVSREGSRVAALIGKVPTRPAELAALRRKVLSRETVAGSLVSVSGKAALVLVSLDPAAQASPIVAALRKAVAPLAGPLSLTFIGAPAVAEFAGRAAVARIPIVAPIAVVVLLLLLGLWSSRESGRIAGVLLPVTAGGLGALWTLAFFVALGLELEPTAAGGLVIPLAVGLCAGSVVARRGLRANIFSITLSAGIVAVAMLAMAAQPALRQLGVIGAAGAVFGGLATVLLGALRSFAPPAPDLVTEPNRARRPAMVLGLIGMAFAAAGGLGVVPLDFEWTTTSMFGANEEPRRAEEFLRRHFDTDDNVFVRVRADLRDPRAVRYLERLEEDLGTIEGVADIQGIVTPLRIVHRTLTGRRQLPSDRKRLGQLWRMLEGNRGVSILVDDRRTEALLRLRIATPDARSARAAVLRVRKIVDRTSQVLVAQTPFAPTAAFRRLLAAQVTRRLGALAVRFGRTPPRNLAAWVEARVAELTPAGVLPVVRRAVDGYFRSDEALYSLRAKKEPPALATERSGRIAARLAPLVVGEGSPTQVAVALRENIPPAELKDDPGGIAKAAPMLMVRVRSALLEHIARRGERLLPPALQRAGLEPSRASRFQGALRTILYSLLDKSVVRSVPGGSGGIRLQIAATAPTLVLESGARAIRGAMEMGGLSAAGLIALLATAALFSLGALGSVVPAILAALAAFGFLGLAAIPFDPSGGAVLAIALGVGGFAGCVAFANARRGQGHPLEVAIPLFALSAFFLVLTAAGFAPAQRFCAMAAVALLAAAVAAAWLAAISAPVRRKS